MVALSPQVDYILLLLSLQLRIPAAEGAQSSGEAGYGMGVCPVQGRKLEEVGEEFYLNYGCAQTVLFHAAKHVKSIFRGGKTSQSRIRLLHYLPIFHFDYFNSKSRNDCRAGP